MTKIAAGGLKPVKGHVIGKGESPTLENLIEECRKSQGSWGLLQNDIAFALSFWSMIDYGFECISREKTQPKHWKHETRRVYEAQFFLPPYSDYTVKLVAMPAADVLCINALVSDSASNLVGLKSLAVHSPGYVPLPEDDAFSPNCSGFTDLQSLLKNNIVWPMRCTILNEQGVMNGSLCGVTDEIKLKIVRLLSVPDVLMLSQTCRDLNNICNNQGLWKAFFHDNFLCQCATQSGQCEEVTDWKENYRQAYMQRKSDGNSESSPAEWYYTPPEDPYGSEIDFAID